MKKTVILLAAAVLTLTACVNNSEEEDFAYASQSLQTIEIFHDPYLTDFDRDTICVVFWDDPDFAVNTMVTEISGLWHEDAVHDGLRSSCAQWGGGGEGA